MSALMFKLCCHAYCGCAGLQTLGPQKQQGSKTVRGEWHHGAPEPGSCGMTASGLRVQVCDGDRLGEKLLLESQAANASSQPAFFQDVENQ